MLEVYGTIDALPTLDEISQHPSVKADGFRR
jgi:hypothetical protein